MRPLRLFFISYYRVVTVDYTEELIIHWQNSLCKTASLMHSKQSGLAEWQTFGANLCKSAWIISATDTDRQTDLQTDRRTATWLTETWRRHRRHTRRLLQLMHRHKDPTTSTTITYDETNELLGECWTIASHKQRLDPRHRVPTWSCLSGMHICPLIFALLDS